MTEIKVITEMCAEDRARIDALNANLDKVINLISPTTLDTISTPFPATVPTKAPKKPQEAPAPDTQEKSQPEPETATEPVQPESYDVLAPQYTVDDVRQKVVSLCAANKKAEVKAIVSAYAESVSTIPADKVDEVMERLNALEG